MFTKSNFWKSHKNIQYECNSHIPIADMDQQFKVESESFDPRLKNTPN